MLMIVSVADRRCSETNWERKRTTEALQWSTIQNVSLTSYQITAFILHHLKYN